jgi:hypothetical protein
MDWAAILALGAEIARASGDSPSAVNFQQELISLNLGTVEPLGRFRKRFMSLIKRQMEAGQRS